VRPPGRGLGPPNPLVVWSKRLVSAHRFLYGLKMQASIVSVEGRCVLSFAPNAARALPLLLGLAVGCGSPSEGAGSGTGTATGTATNTTTGTAADTNTAGTTTAQTNTGTSTTMGQTDTGTSSTDTGTTGPACPPDQALCGGACVDTQTDVAHCGACDSPCGDFELCEAGTCQADTMIAQIDAGEVHVCVRTVTGRVRCWGRNLDGQLGLGHTNDIGDNELPNTTLDVDLGAPALQIAAGRAHTCALVEGGTVRCWGNNDNLQLGIPGPALDAPDPAKEVEGVTAAIAIDAGLDHTCALLEGGAIRCWGHNFIGQLGYGHTSDSLALSDVNVGAPATALAVGATHTCALLDGGDVRCWGSAGTGELGSGAPTPVIGDDEDPADGPLAALGGPVVAITAGFQFTCALLDDEQSVLCWGWGSGGRLGYGSTDNVGDDETPASQGPVALSPNAGAEAVSDLDGGKHHTCVVFEDGAMHCWGRNAAGQLGYGSTNNVGDGETPADLGLVPAPPAAMTAGGDHFRCMVTTGGAVRCWGFNAYGQLGYGHTMNLGTNPNEVPSMLPDVSVFP